jgi:hypothetical protein
MTAMYLIEIPELIEILNITKESLDELYEFNSNIKIKLDLKTLRDLFYIIESHPEKQVKNYGLNLINEILVKEEQL